MGTTLKDVARQASVSICTVSHVLNNTPNYTVRSETRAKILEAAARLNYQPNMIARGLAKRRSYLLGVVVGSISVSFEPETLQGIQTIADDLGYSILLYTHMGNPERERKYLDLLVRKRVDGIIIKPMFPQNLAALQNLQASLPIVQMNTTLPGLDVPAVVADHTTAGRLATEHLIRLGHRRIAHLRGSDVHGAMRYEGYRQVLREHGIPEDPELVLNTSWEWEQGLNITLRLLDRPDRPTALVAGADMVALGAIRAARRLGLSVPGDLAVVGIGDERFAPLMEVPLTTVALPKGESGSLAVQTLHHYIENGQAPDHLLDVHLVVRDSCGAQQSLSL